MNNGFTLYNLITRFHGAIHRIELSYAQRETPKDPKAYKEWFEETNKTFHVEMDLWHTEQKIEDFSELLPYLNLEVTSWSIGEANGETILEVDLK